jgi:hypothetical protein
MIHRRGARLQEREYHMLLIVSIMMGPFLMKSVTTACQTAALSLQIWLVLGANDGEKHPQCIQHYQEDRSQEDKRDIERDIGKGLVTGMERQRDVPHRRIL